VVPRRGDIVDFHFLHDQTLKIRPAMVVDVVRNRCNLQVFYDGPNDGREPGAYIGWVTGVPPLVGEPFVHRVPNGSRLLAVQRADGSFDFGPFYSTRSEAA
jgi:hypothetical protein